jgi:hypothetical protein
MAGLDIIKKYADGGEATSPSENPVIQTTAPKNTGIVGKISLDPTQTETLLNNMQKYLDERTGGFSKFMGGLKDAAAWTAGGAEGPSAALAVRDREKLMQSQDILSTQQQMAAYRAAQSQALNDAEFMKNARGTPGGGAGAGGIGGGDLISQLGPEARQRIANARNPTEAREILQEELKTIGGARAKGQFEAAGNKPEKYFIPGKGYVDMTPNMFNNLPEDIKKQILDATTAQIRGGNVPTSGTTGAATSGTTGAATSGTATSGTGARVAADVNNPTGIKSGNAFKAYNSPQDGVMDTQNLVNTYLSGSGPMKGIKPTPENFNGMWINGKAETGSDPALKMHLDLIKSELQKSGIKLNADGTIPNTPEANAAITRAKIIGEAGQKNAAKFLPFVGAQSNYSPVAAAPVTTSAQDKTAPVTTTTSANVPYSLKDLPPEPQKPSPRNFGTSSEFENANKKYETDLKNWEELRKSKIGISEKEQLKGAEEAGTRKAEMDKRAKDADSTISSADIAIAANKNHPEAFGMGVKNKLIGYGGDIGDILLPKEKEGKMENLLARPYLSQDALAARKQHNIISSQLGVDYAANVFKGARMGIGLENLAAKAKGVSNDNPPEINILNATVIKEAARFNKERYELFYKTWAPEHGGPTNTSFAEFEASKEYEALANTEKQRILKALPNYLKLDAKGDLVEIENAKNPPSKFDKYRK